MCTKTIQNETAKRRAIQDELRPLAEAVFARNAEGAPSATDQHVRAVLREASGLIQRLGIRSCCITFPGEAHGSQGRPCILR